MAEYRKIPTVFEYLPLNEIVGQSNISAGIIERLILEGTIPAYIHVEESTDTGIYPKLEEKDLETLRTIHYQQIPVSFDYLSPKGFTTTSFYLHCINRNPYADTLLSLENIQLSISATGFFKAENIVFIDGSLATHTIVRARFRVIPLSDCIVSGIPPFDDDAERLEKKLLDELKKPIRTSAEIRQGNIYLKPDDVNKVIDLLNGGESTLEDAGKPAVSVKPDEVELLGMKDGIQAEELKIALEAYFHAENTIGKTFKQRISAFLEDNYRDLTVEQKKRIATLANKDKTTGRK